MARRADLQSGVDRAEAALEELDAEDLTETCGNAKDELTAAGADVKRRMEQIADAEQPSTLADARAWRDREEDALHIVESDVTRLKASRDTLQLEQGNLE